MTGKANVPEETKKNVRSVLISNPKGVRLPYFERDYRSLLGHGVPWRKHGYTSLASFMAALPDVVRVEFSQQQQDYRYFAVADGDLFLPSALKRGVREIGGNIPKSVTMSWEEQLKPNLCGHYALSFAKPPGITRDEVSEEFQKAGDVVEVSFTHRYVFVRFCSKEETMRAMEMYQRKYSMFIPDERYDPKQLVKKYDTQKKRKNYTKGFKNESKEEDLVEVYVGAIARDIPEELITARLDGINIYGVRDVQKEDKSQKSIERYMFIRVKRDRSEEAVMRLHHATINGCSIISQLSFLSVDTPRPQGEEQQEGVNVVRGHQAVLTDLNYEVNSSEEEHGDINSAGMPPLEPASLRNKSSQPPSDEVPPPLEMLPPPLELSPPPLENIPPPLENIPPPLENIPPPLENIPPPLEKIAPLLKSPPRNNESHEKLLPVKKSPPPLEKCPPPLEKVPPPLEKCPPPLEKSHPPLEKAPPPLEKSPPPLEKAPPPLEKAPPPLEKAPPPLEKAPPPLEKAPPPLEKAPPPLEKAPPPLEKAPPPLEKAPPPLEKSHPPLEKSPPPPLVPPPLERVPPLLPHTEASVPGVEHQPPREADIPPLERVLSSPPPPHVWPEGPPRPERIHAAQAKVGGGGRGAVGAVGRGARGGGVGWRGDGLLGPMPVDLMLGYDRPLLPLPQFPHALQQPLLPTSSQPMNVTHFNNARMSPGWHRPASQTSSNGGGKPGLGKTETTGFRNTSSHRTLTDQDRVKHGIGRGATYQQTER